MEIFLLSPWKFVIQGTTKPTIRPVWPPIPEMSAKKVIFRMENCGHLPAEVCGVLGRFVRKSTQAGNFFCADVRNISICRSAVVRREVHRSLRTSVRTSADIFADVYADVRMDWCGRLHGLVRTSAWIGADVRMDWCGRPHGLVWTSAWMGADVCGRPHGWVQTSAGPEDLLELLPLLCNNLLIICGITWSYAMWLSF